MAEIVRRSFDDFASARPPKFVPEHKEADTVLLRYGLGAGTPGTGDMRREDRGVGSS